MTNNSKIKEDSFILVTSQRRHKKTSTNKRSGQKLKSNQEEIVDEEFIIG